MMEEAILHVCRESFQTPRNIAARLGRDAGNFTSRYLSDLVARGRLEQKYPETPAHPAQAYRTVRP